MARNHEVAAAPQSVVPAPRHATVWASLVYAIATLMLAYPGLGGAFLLNPRSDQYKAGYAFREFAAEHLRSGRGFPQWNPFIEGGLPYIAAMHGDIFYPTFLLRMILPTDVAMTWEFPIHLFLCGLFTFLFLRAWSISFWGALVGGLAYMLGGSIAAYAGPGHDGKLFVSTLLPLVVLLLTRGIRDDRLWAWGALAVTIGLAALSPHPQLLQYLLLTAGVFSLYLAFAAHTGSSPLPRPVAVKRLAFAAGAVALGLLISAVQYWPLLKYKPWSPRSGGHPWEIATSYSFPIEETLNAYWPQFSGILDNYWGRNIIHFHSDYFGVIVLMLVGSAFGTVSARQKSFRRIWLGIGIGALLWAFGGYTPLFRVIFAVVPGTKDFRAPSTMIYVAAFAVSVLAAIGMDRMLARRMSPKYPIAWAIAGVVFAVLMSVGGYAALSSGLIATMSNALPPQYLDRASQLAGANSGAAVLGAWRSLLFVAVGAGLIWAWLTNRIAGKVVASALVAVLVVDLVSIERMYWIFSPRAATLYASDPALDAIKADIAKTGGGPSRVWTEPLSAAVEQRDPAFAGDALMSHGLRIVGNYHGNELAIYQQVVAAGNLARRDDLKIFSPEFWRHENVGYLYTGANDSTLTSITSQLTLTSPPVRLAGPVRNAAGSMVYAYKLPVQSRPAWVATAMTKAPEDQALATILDPRFDPGRIAIIDTSATAIQAQPLQTLPPASSAVASVTAATDGSYDIALDQPAAPGSALVVSENYFPGWKATADGKSATVARTNYNLIGVALPTGAKTIQLRFTDAAYEKGKLVTLFALAVAVAVWILGWIVERRRPIPTLPRDDAVAG